MLTAEFGSLRKRADEISDARIDEMVYDITHDGHLPRYVRRRCGGVW